MVINLTLEELYKSVRESKSESSKAVARYELNKAIEAADDATYCDNKYTKEI